VTIGRFSSNKRLDRLLDTMRLLTARDPAWRLSILGSPSDWTSARLAAEIASRALDAHVTVHVSPDNAAVRAALGQASLFASASEHEGFGLVLVEALSAGLLPVVHGNAAFRTLAPRLPLATLTDFANPAEAAAALETQYADLARNVDELRAQAAASVRAFSWPQVAARYAGVYGAVLEPGFGTLAARPSPS
jgi:alpha-1,3-mannosyltransferase